ncbi:hypothetical protein BC826DRAFT_319273 [Russula brevipes]|nr:hypothetical protein BC826DRAFT_319273 [Russula brevipes]
MPIVNQVRTPLAGAHWGPGRSWCLPLTVNYANASAWHFLFGCRRLLSPFNPVADWGTSPWSQLVAINVSSVPWPRDASAAHVKMGLTERQLDHRSRSAIRTAILLVGARPIPGGPVKVSNAAFVPHRMDRGHMVREHMRLQKCTYVVNDLAPNWKHGSSRSQVRLWRHRGRFVADISIRLKVSASGPNVLIPERRRVQSHER